MSELTIELQRTLMDGYGRMTRGLQNRFAVVYIRGIHHIGSTAIPGMAAKAVIDIMAGVRDLHGPSGIRPTAVALLPIHATPTGYSPLLQAAGAMVDKYVWPPLNRAGK